MHEVRPSAKTRELAQKAADKKATLGEDVDLSTYASDGDKHEYQQDLSGIPSEQRDQMVNVGVTLDDLSLRGGTFVQVDQSVIHSSASQEGVEVMPILQALETHGWLEDYWWKAVGVDVDKYTANVELAAPSGYFIRTLPGVKSVNPVQACLYLGHKNLAQKVHNIIIAEEGSELHIITGCATHPMQPSGLHLGVSEFYIKKGARITFTMIHNWAPDIAVRPRSAAVIEEDGVFLSNFVCMKPVRTLQTNPLATCAGDNAVVRFNSVLVAPRGSTLDTGSRVVLQGRGSRAEIISRAITTGGDIIARGYIQGSAPEVKGHLECRGLILSEELGGVIHAIPELRGELAGVDLSHEAAVGKIAEEEVEYLMARGLTRDEATATIVRGFLRVDIEGLPPELAAELKQAIETSEQDVL
jgi:Fe-S cluster assembly scaffold protein SufB